MNFLKEKIRLLRDKMHGYDPVARARAKKILVATVVGLVVFIVLVLVVGQGITGLTISRTETLSSYEEQTEALQQELSLAATNLTSCQTFYQGLLVEVEKYSTQYAECEGRIGSVEASLATKDAENAQRIVELQEQIDESGKLRDDYDALADDAAKKLCCIEKQLKNSNINSFTVDNNKIVCLENGEKSISC